MKQLALFDDMPDKSPCKKPAKPQQVAMFSSGELFLSRVTRLECPNPSGAPGTLFDLVLAYPDETEEEAREREARERHINSMFSARG
ncbi:MAG: hypothetical protein AAF787_00140 [Chloroflexota bacterium]